MNQYTPQYRRAFERYLEEDAIASLHKRCIEVYGKLGVATIFLRRAADKHSHAAKGYLATARHCYQQHAIEERKKQSEYEYER